MTINYNEWMKNPHKIFCNCSCKQEIVIKLERISQYKQYGIPEYILGHNNRGKKLRPLSGERKKFLRERIFTKEWRRKISESKIGNKNAMYGKKHTAEHTEKLSLNHRDIFGENNPMKDVIQRLNASKRQSLCLGENSPNWQGGIAYLPYCNKFNNKLKEKIRNRDNRVCQECSKTELENGRKLDVHHVHYDKPNCNPDLISLCCVCNIKANGNRDYWEEHFMNKLKEYGVLNL